MVRWSDIELEIPAWEHTPQFPGIYAMNMPIFSYSTRHCSVIIHFLECLIDGRDGFFFLPYRFPVEGRTKHCGYVVLLYENEYTSTAGATTDKKLIISEKRYYLIRLRRAFVSF